MTVSPQQTVKLLTGSFTFKQLGFSMLVTKLKLVYAKDNSSSNLLYCTEEINTFLSKFNAVMSDDFAIITKI